MEIGDDDVDVPIVIQIAERGAAGGPGLCENSTGGLRDIGELVSGILQ